MTNPAVTSFGNYIPESYEIPKNEQELRIFLKTQFENFAKLLNRKDTASYEEVELQNNQQFFGATPRQKRFAFRRVYDFGAIAAGAVLNIPHGLAGVVEYTRIYGTVITNVVDYRPIPYVSVVAVNQGIQVGIVGINIVITNGAAAAPITSGLIVLEYLKN